MRKHCSAFYSLVAEHLHISAQIIRQEIERAT
jgi:hypothetical protein